MMITEEFSKSLRSQKSQKRYYGGQYSRNHIPPEARVIGAMVGVPILIGLTRWLIYRIGRGWLRLGARRPMDAI